jgi:uncharacterized membrane protein YbaN (DUF454 family)
MTDSPLIDDPRPARSRVQRWLLVAVGVVLVGFGALGVFVPGLPTTIFLIGASWCFARSCPWLEERLIRIPLFRPFLVYLDDGARMPRKAIFVTLAVMWTAVAFSSAFLGFGDPPRPALAITVVAAGLVGTLFVLRLARRRAEIDIDAAE